MKMKNVGISFSGSAGWNTTRWSSTAKSRTQKRRPTPKKNQLTSPGSSVAPGTATRMFPTTGRNQAGLACPTSKRPRKSQAESTASVSASCRAPPATLKARASVGAWGSQAAASSVRLMATVGKKASLTGWAHSARTAAG